MHSADALYLAINCYKNKLFILFILRKLLIFKQKITDRVGHSEIEAVHPVRPTRKMRKRTDPGLCLFGEI